LVQVFLNSLNDVRVQIPDGEFVPTLQDTCGKAQWRHNVQQDDLGMEMASQERGLTNHPQRDEWEINRQKNLIH
jgi:hypothetical protein